MHYKKGEINVPKKSAGATRGRPKKKKKTKLKKRNVINIIILLIIICIIIYALFTIIKLVVKPADHVLIERGSIAMEEPAIGYIIREETLLKNKDTDKNIIPIKAEGEKVAKNQRIARYYNSDEPELIAKIDEINNKIQGSSRWNSRFIFK